MIRVDKKFCVQVGVTGFIIFHLLILVPCLVASSLNSSESYNWPLKPFSEQHWINGTFCENRPNNNMLRHHFHNGIDIHLPQNGEVYSVIDGMVTAIDPYKNGGYIRIGRFAYVHVVPNPSLQVGDMVKAYETIIGVTDSHNHLHFVEGYPGDEVNPLREDGGLRPFEDKFAPIVKYVHFYIHGTTTRFPTNRVSGYVDIAACASDRTDDGPMGDNNGIYRLGYQIFAQDGTTPVSEPIVPFTFNRKPDDSYIKNVYALGSDLSTYVYLPSNRIDQRDYWDTTQLQPGRYVVGVFAEDTGFGSDTLKVPVTVVTPDSIPPSPPRWKALIIDDRGNLILSWETTSSAQGQADWLIYPDWTDGQNDSSDVAGFRLYYSYDGQNWYLQQNEQILADTVRQIRLTGFNLQQPIFFRLTAVDNAAICNESEPSEIYGVRKSSSVKRVLIVDAVDQITNENSVTSRNHVLQYQQLLMQLGDYGFEVCTQQAIRDGMVNIEQYDCLLYFFHHDSSSQEILSVQEQKALQEYLQQGGAVFINGGNLGEAALTDSNEIAMRKFYKNVLMAEYGGKVAVNGQITGCAGSVFSNLQIYLTNDLFSQWIESLLPQGEAQATFALYDSIVVGLQYCGRFNQFPREGRLVYLTFPLEDIVDENVQCTVLKQILGFFFSVSTHDRPEVGRQRDTALQPQYSLTCYPNPFGRGFGQEASGSEITTIRFELPERQDVVVTIYNILGQKVRTLFRGILAAGSHTLIWDGSDETGEVVPSGIYFCQFQTKYGIITKKILFLGSLTD
ncbi:hypothetical protein DRP98_00890 [candidate division KSB1 bacterium]|nr:MAG: hypothetical protein DRP98_00890 [candidate division KSB1 bacterium]